MKKKLLMALSLVLVAVMSIGGTIAFLTATTETVTNTFSVGNITMTLDEAALNDDGTENESATRVIENEYKIVPGASIVKDPTVHVEAGSEPCYVYVCIDDAVNGTVQGAAVYNVDSAYWETVGTIEGTNKTVYKYKTIVDATSADQDLIVFDGVTFNGAVITTDNITSLDEKTITVDAYAHQSANIGETNINALALAHFTPETP